MDWKHFIVVFAVMVLVMAALGLVLSLRPGF
jgi:hypothetical protein